MLALRRLVRKEQCYLFRNYSSNIKLVEETQDNETGIMTISMAKAPVNGLNTELLSKLKDSFQNAKKLKSRGIILTSSLPTVFSGGLDINEFYKTDANKARTFWSTLQDMWITLYSMEIPVAAAINGNSPAGGCMLAMSCEYRVFVDEKFTIGLNETKLGIVAPKWFREMYINILGCRQAEIALLRGELFPPKEALKIGLVDELATNKAEAIKKCNDYILSYAKISPMARGKTKLALRESLLQWMKENKEAEIKGFVDYILIPQVQEGLRLYLESLKKKQ